MGELWRPTKQGGEHGGPIEMHGGAGGAETAVSSPVRHSHPQKDSANSSPPHLPLTRAHQSAHKEQRLLPALKAAVLSGMADTECNSSHLWVGSTSGAAGSPGAGYAGPAPVSSPCSGKHLGPQGMDLKGSSGPHTASHPAKWKQEVLEDTSECKEHETRKHLLAAPCLPSSGEICPLSPNDERWKRSKPEELCLCSNPSEI